MSRFLLSEGFNRRVDSTESCVLPDVLASPDTVSFTNKSFSRPFVVGTRVIKTFPLLIFSPNLLRKSAFPFKHALDVMAACSAMHEAASARVIDRALHECSREGRVQGQITDVLHCGEGSQWG